MSWLTWPVDMAAKAVTTPWGDFRNVSRLVVARHDPKIVFGNLFGQHTKFFVTLGSLGLAQRLEGAFVGLLQLRSGSIGWRQNGDALEGERLRRGRPLVCAS